MFFKKVKTAESQSIDLLTAQLAKLTEELTHTSEQVYEIRKAMQGLLDEAGQIRNLIGK